MKVSVVGTGYVGLVVGAGLAETGNDVICADTDESKIALLNANRIPIHEPGLDAMVLRNAAAGRLRFTGDTAAAVRHADVVFIAVGTPPDEDGSADLRHVLDVAEVIGRNMDRPKVIATKSTVPVGTAQRVRAAIAALTSTEFDVCSNPEFLKEGAALDDFMKPDRVVIGADSPRAAEALRQLYKPFVRTGNPLIVMDIASSEMTKYAANAMLATRIAFMNQVAELCESVGADVGEVRKGLASDNRIGPAFLFPGPGFGGSCFPKDIRALLRTARENHVSLDIVAAVDEANERQKRRVLGKVLTVLKAPGQATVAVWGLAFKAGTDDMRESPALVVVNGLLDAGVTVRAHDPAAREVASCYFGDRVAIVDDAYQALDGAHALCVLTEWLEYRNPDFGRMRAGMAAPVIVDARNLFDPGQMRDAGFAYVGIGRE